MFKMIILSLAVVNNPKQMNYNNWCEYVQGVSAP